MRQITNQAGLIYKALLGVVFVIVISFAGFLIFRIFHFSVTGQTAASSQTQQNAGPHQTNTYAVLKPAVVPSKVAECQQAISFSGNGNSGPTQCANGDLNVTEWKALAALEPTVMRLGYNPSISQLEADMCKDANASSSDANTHNSNATEATVYRISTLYYGWHFTLNPASVLSTCS